jgi:hypothetical protein
LVVGLIELIDSHVGICYRRNLLNVALQVAVDLSGDLRLIGSVGSDPSTADYQVIGRTLISVVL